MLDKRWLAQPALMNTIRNISMERWLEYIKTRGRGLDPNVYRHQFEWPLLLETASEQQIFASFKIKPNRFQDHGKLDKFLRILTVSWATPSKCRPRTPSAKRTRYRSIES